MKNKKKRAVTILQEFKEFALRGNVMDLAIGVIIGGAFGQITSSLVSDIMMPAIGLLVGGIDFTDYNIEIPVDGKAPVNMNLGTFIGVIVNFFIIAFCTFLLVKGINRLRRLTLAEKDDTPAPPPAQEVLLTEIRDLLTDIRNRDRDTKS